MPYQKDTSGSTHHCSRCGGRSLRDGEDCCIKCDSLMVEQFGSVSDGRYKLYCDLPPTLPISEYNLYPGY